MPKIYISPSSQEANTGPNGYVEEVVMNLIADSLIPELVRHGFDVMRNKRGNTYAGHIIESNQYKPDIHFAIHSNAMGGAASGKARGCEVFCYDPTNTASLGTQLAQKIYAGLSAITPTADRGIKSGKDTISEIRNTKAPACLVEIAFHDNPDDARWIVENIAAISKVFLLSMIALFGIPYRCTPTESNVGANRGIVDDIARLIEQQKKLLGELKL